MTGSKRTFTEIIEWHELEGRPPVDDDEILLIQFEDGEVFPAFLDGEQWRHIDASEAEAPQRWAHWPKGRG